MELVRLVLVVVSLIGLHWAIGVDSKENGSQAIGASSKTKQGFIAVAKPNNFWMRPQYPQITRYPQYPFYFMQPRTTVASPPPKFDYKLLLIAYYLAIRLSTTDPVTTSATVTTSTAAVTTTTASSTMTTATSTTTSVSCVWETWGTCTLVCKGTRTRRRTCNGIPAELQSESCNTEPGFQDDGWYRASNCLEYLVVGASQSHDESTTHCEDTLSGKLASTGMRDETTRPEILEKLYESQGIVRDAWIGVNDIDTQGTYEWTDGHTGMPTFWNQFQPNNNNHRCHVVVLGNPRSLGDLACNSNHLSICEREIPQ